MSFDLDSFYKCLISGAEHIPETLELVLIPILTGLILGTLIALARFHRVKVLSQILAVIVNIYLGVPLAAALLIYQLLFLTRFDRVSAVLHLGLQAKDINIIWVGIFALSLQATCMMSETIRGALNSVNKGQWEAGFSIGMTGWQTARQIILPQILPEAVPNLISLSIGLFKNSSVCMAIGVAEITFGACLPAQIDYSYIEAYTAATLIYWVITIVIERVGARLERRLNSYKVPAV